MKKTLLILSIVTLFFAGCKKDDMFEKGDMGVVNGHAWVDLGLPSGTKWATCNVGATTPEEYGDYFAWGDTTTKSDYSGLYCPTYGLIISQLQSQGYIDSEGNLNPQYDAARANWGGSWRMPTESEMQELIDKCTWTWTTYNGVKGYNVECPNGNSIFLPAAGSCSSSSSFSGLGSHGFYWSSTPYSTSCDESYNYTYAYELDFRSDFHYMDYITRYFGRSVRPVFGGNFEGPEEQPEEQPEEPETPSANQSFTVNGVSFTMIAVEGGTFSMGATSEQGSDADDDEKPAHKVTLSDYYIGETEVTQELWEAVMGRNPSYFSGYPQRPVEYVSWNNCQEFIKKLNQLTGKNFRLPTEAEWEYAARGGNKSQGYKYSGSNTIDNVAWYYSNISSQTHDVKTKQANELGIYDMSGNVLEWCQDWYDSNYYSSSPVNNPTGPTSGSTRVRRGGSWYNSALYCRVSDRCSDAPGYSDYYYGFRLAL